MTLDEIRASLPDEFQPWVTQYSPVLILWTVQDLKAWIETIKAGNLYDAEGKLYNAMTEAQKLAEWDVILAQWAGICATEKGRRELSKQMLAGFVQILIGIALAAVGL